MVDPISPDEVVDAKRAAIPDEVIQVFNDLIAQHWDGYSSEFTQYEILELLSKKLKGKKKKSKQEILDAGYLDVEEIFEEMGWKVVYDKPAYNETYEPTFEFSKR